MLAVVIVFVGGCLGGALRHGFGSSETATFAVNVLGSLLLGAVVVMATPRTRLLVGTGFCGALTTFGSVAARGAAPLLLHIAAGTAAAGLGVVLARSLPGDRRKRGTSRLGPGLR